MIVVGFALLAVVGTLARAGAVHWMNRPDLPVGTFCVNLLGAFALGMLAGTSSATMTVVGAGGLGSLTTFSTVAQEVAVMVRTRRTLRAAIYVSATLIVGTAAGVAGLELA